MDNDMKIEAIQEIIKLIKEIPDPYVWVNNFRQSYIKFKKDSELKEVAKSCIELSNALYDLERNPSHFLYDIVPNKALSELTDEQLQDVNILKKIANEVDKFTKDYKQVSDAFASVEKQAYKKLGNVIVELGKGLDQRKNLLSRLASIVNERKQPQEIREIGYLYIELIATIQPLREAIRCFVDEYS